MSKEVTQETMGVQGYSFTDDSPPTGPNRLSAQNKLDFNFEEWGCICNPTDSILCTTSKIK